MQVVSPPPLTSTNRHVELSRAKWRTDGSVRHTKKGCFVQAGAVQSGENNGLFWGGFFFSSSWQSSQVFIWCLETNFLKLSIPKGLAEKVLFPHL